MKGRSRVQYRIIFNPHEMRVLAAMEKQMGKEFNVEMLAKEFYAHASHRPKNWRESVLARMRKLAVKTQMRANSTGDLIVQRVSRLGRSSEASYCMGRF